MLLSLLALKSKSHWLSGETYLRLCLNVCSRFEIVKHGWTLVEHVLKTIGIWFHLRPNVAKTMSHSVRPFRITLHTIHTLALLGDHVDTSVHSCTMLDVIDCIFIILRLTAPPQLLIWTEASLGATIEVRRVAASTTISKRSSDSGSPARGCTYLSKTFLAQQGATPQESWVLQKFTYFNVKLSRARTKQRQNRVFKTSQNPIPK